MGYTGKSIPARDKKTSKTLTKTWKTKQMQKSRFDLTGINEVVGIFADAEGHEARRA